MIKDNFMTHDKDSYGEDWVNTRLTPRKLQIWHYIQTTKLLPLSNAQKWERLTQQKQKCPRKMNTKLGTFKIRQENLLNVIVCTARDSASSEMLHCHKATFLLTLKTDDRFFKIDLKMYPGIVIIVWEVLIMHKESDINEIVLGNSSFLIESAAAVGAALFLPRSGMDRWPPWRPFLPTVRPHLHQASASTLWWRLQHCFHWKEWSHSKMGCNPILEWLFVSFDFNESYVASVIAALTLTLGVNEPLLEFHGRTCIISSIEVRRLHWQCELLRSGTIVCRFVNSDNYQRNFKIIWWRCIGREFIPLIQRYICINFGSRWQETIPKNTCTTVSNGFIDFTFIDPQFLDPLLWCKW